MKEATKEVNEVIDKTTDRWIKVVGIFAGITMVLVAAIGVLFNSKMDTNNLVLEQIRKGVNAVSSITANHEGRISSNTSDIKEVRGVLTDHLTNHK